jgi:hypothetical protein
MFMSVMAATVGSMFLLFPVSRAPLPPSSRNWLLHPCTGGWHSRGIHSRAEEVVISTTRAVVAGWDMPGLPMAWLSAHGWHAASTSYKEQLQPAGVAVGGRWVTG